MTDVDADATVSAEAERAAAEDAEASAGVASDETPATAGEDADVDESFDPIGTAVLIGIYMAIVVLMWIFTYFIEFLGRGVTIVG